MADTSPSPGARLHPAVFRMAGAHFVADAYSNIFAPLLPALIPRLGLSLAGAGTLAMLYQLASSISQLGFGQVADRWRPRPFLLAGPVLSVVVLSCVGVASTPVMLAAILMIGGLGGAAFHPSAAAVVSRVGGAHRGLSMAVHVTSGTVGYALGPLVFAPYVQHVGLVWTPLLALPGLALLAFILPGVPDIRNPGSSHARGFSGLRPYARPLSLLYLIVVLRTLTSIGFATFVPVMLTRQGWTVAQAGAAISAYLFASGIGGFSGGPLADRFGARRVIMVSMVVAAPVLFAATRLPGLGFVALMTVAGLFLQSTLPVNVTYAHQLAPVNAATVSSLIMGVAWGTGGLVVPVIGMAADRIGIEATLSVVALLPLLGALCAWRLPDVRGHEPVPGTLAAGPGVAPGE